jgi:uncharacterized protein with HEPN domain
MNKDQFRYLKDIKKAILSIESFVEGMNFEEFNNDDKTTSAVIRKLEIIGEATKSISNTIRDKYSQIPWKEMAGMRDRLIHGYSEVDFNLVWETIQRKLTELKLEIQKILDEEKEVT